MPNLSADVYIEVSKDIPNARMVSLAGTFLCKVFEGPCRDIGAWINNMKSYVSEIDKHLRKMYFYYTTCPKYAKKYSKNLCRHPC